MKKDYASARNMFQREISFSGGDLNDPGWAMIIAQVEAVGDKKADAVKKLDEAVKQHIITQNLSTFSCEIAIAYSLLGENQKAIEWLEKADTSGDNGFLMLNIDPRLKNLQSETGFQKLLKRSQKARV